MVDAIGVIARVQAAYGHACFACGRDNPIGMHLRLVGEVDGWVEARFDPRPDFVGVPGTLHGGITAAALDEALVWAGILQEGVMTVTGTLDIRYRRPIGVDVAITARSRVAGRSGRRLRLEGRLEVAGTVAAEASGVYLKVSDVDELEPADG